MQTTGKFLRRAAGAATAVALLGTLGMGCLTRPVKRAEPTTKTNFTAVVRQTAVDKVDLLFAIDNSASMGDKQDLLAQAVPDLMSRLVTPNCVDKDGNPTGKTTSTGDDCGAGSKPEFQPVHDMHVGIVTSSLGGLGSDSCAEGTKNPTNPALDSHQNDHAHLIARGGVDEHPVAAAAGGNFLAWFPDTPKNNGHAAPNVPIKDAKQLNSDFQDMVSGVHEYGCGFEAQLESFYRFLIQPDPYKTITKNGDGRAQLNDVDEVILQQRHDFLRPDSLVAIILLSDENESTVDPLAIGGQGWAYENTSFPGSTTGAAAKGTSACGPNPNSDQCQSCGFCDRKTNTPAEICGDPNCQGGGYYSQAEDSLNERFFHMKQRFGVDPQYPIERYTVGLTSLNVPDRDGEHPNGSANYVGVKNCSNPLFSTNLPAAADAGNHDKLCKMPKGPRGPDLVFFGVIGGVPWQLLLDERKEFKTSFNEDDWTKILGKDPLHYDFTGVDPHMYESIVPRAGNKQVDPAGVLVAPNGAVNTDFTKTPYNGREWDTGGSDLQYACIFKLPQEKDCTLDKYKNACDCDGKKDTPLCDPSVKTKQIFGKAYPTIKEFSVVRALKDQGIIASLCPRTLDPTNKDYGYRPAVRAIVDRLKNALANQCLPQALTVDPTGQVSCLILLSLQDQPGGEERCVEAQGLIKPDDQVLAKFREQQDAEWKAGGGAQAGLPDPKTFAVCELKQLVVPPGDSCAEQPEAGWCYVTNASGKQPAGTCPQAILFTSAGQKTGARISLQCIEQSGGGDNAPAPSRKDGG